MPTIAEFIKKFNSQNDFSGMLRFGEPMSEHTTFRAGGPADVWIRPADGVFPEYSWKLIQAARRVGIPVFILGGGANLVVADGGIRGIVLDTGGWSGVTEEKPGESAKTRERGEKSITLFIKSGTPVDAAAEYAAARGLSALEFLAGMPGTIGGALWMNARCYEKQVSDALVEAEALDFGAAADGADDKGGEEPVRRLVPFREEDFGYKKSPFQTMDALILGGRFAFSPRPEAEIRKKMEEHRRDREKKGHYRFPSAGSVFKNNREFGKPTGKIIGELGLKGFAVGDAQIAPWHGNIIINRGNARGSDIKALVGAVKDRVCRETGLELECEVFFAGFS